jgi:hypothetical protein
VILRNCVGTERAPFYFTGKKQIWQRNFVKRGHFADQGVNGITILDLTFYAARFVVSRSCEGRTDYTSLVWGSRSSFQAGWKLLGFFGHGLLTSDLEYII